MIAIIVLLIIGLVVAVIAYKNKKKMAPDYYTYFVIGLVWIPIGIINLIANGNGTFFILGLVFMAIGMSHKDEWKKNHVTLAHFPKAKKRIIITAIVLGLVFFVGIVAYTMLR